MKLGILKEIAPGETRVALVPDTALKFTKSGIDVVMQASAGLNASFNDADYQAVGVTIVPSANDVIAVCDIIAKVQKPTLADIHALKPNTTFIAPIYPMQHPELIQALNTKNITTFALEMIPRIARAQAMDILSSQSSLAGYKSVIMAANVSGKLFPMMTTAAGTIPPAKVIVIGAGVAGLQAIATARRLGAVVMAFDTRPAAGEQVKSLGADFVSLETSTEHSQDAGGYAKEQSAEFYQHEQAILRQYLSAADVVITTALIPGKRAPLLITDDMVAEMKHGAIIVDLASEQQGNCALTLPGEITVVHGVTIIGTFNLPATVPIHASQLFAKNVLNFINYLLPSLKNATFDLDDELIKGCLLATRGELIHALIKPSHTEKESTHAT